MDGLAVVLFYCLKEIFYLINYLSVCKCESLIFPPVSGGAKKMCTDYNIDLIGQVPLEPNILLCTEKGKCLSDQFPESKAA